MLQSDAEPVVLGVTGGVASGKSTVVALFVDCGAQSVSADEIARELLSPGSAMTLSVLSHFGPNFALSNQPDRIDRAKLAKHIFADEGARRELGELMHPTIHLLTQERVGRMRLYPDCKLIAVEIPLLYENGLQSTVDQVLVVSCSESEQVRRLMARHRGAGKSDALRQIRAQMAITEKLRMSDFTVDTDKPLEDVRQEVRKLYGDLTAAGD